MVKIFKDRFYTRQLLAWSCKNNNLDKNRYGDYVIGFDSGLQFFYCQTVAWVKMLLVLVLI